MKNGRRAKVSALTIYPIKSLGGISIDEARVVDRGFELDRRYLLVDERGDFITQRDHARLAPMRTRVADGRLWCHGPEGDALELPLQVAEEPRVRVRVWRSTCDALAVDARADAWFSDHLAIACRLVYMPDSERREIEAPHGRQGEVVSFADGFPFLLIEQASLDDLNGRLERPLPMNRFRPNIVVEGTEPFEADEWKRIRVGEVTFRVAKPCARCVVTTTDQETGTRGVEPLRALATFRRGPNGGVLFGQNLVQESRGTVRVGDEVEVLERVPAQRAPAQRARA